MSFPRVSSMFTIFFHFIPFHFFFRNCFFPGFLFLNYSLMCLSFPYCHTCTSQFNLNPKFPLCTVNYGVNRESKIKYFQYKTDGSFMMYGLRIYCSSKKKSQEVNLRSSLSTRQMLLFTVHETTFSDSREH